MHPPKAVLPKKKRRDKEEIRKIYQVCGKGREHEDTGKRPGTRHARGKEDVRKRKGKEDAHKTRERLLIGQKIRKMLRKRRR